MGDVSGKLQKLVEATRAVLGTDIDLETVPDDQLGVMIDVIAALTDTDKFLIEQAGFDKGELVSLFTQASTVCNELDESKKDIDKVYSYGDLSDGGFKTVETCKLRHNQALSSLSRLAAGIRERAHLKVQLKALSTKIS